MRYMLKSSMFLLAVAVSVTSLTGCETLRETDLTLQSDAAEIDLMSQRVREPVPTRKADTITVDDGIWMGATSIRSASGDELPTDFNHVTLITAEPISLRSFASRVTEITGYPVVVEDSAISGTTGMAPMPTGGADATTPPSVSPMDVAQASLLGVPLNIPEPPTPEPVDPTAGDTKMSFNFNGRLTDLMNRAATGYGVSWRFSEENQELRLFVNETRVYTILAMPGTASFSGDFSSSASQDDAGDSGGSTLRAQQGAKSEADFDFWNEIQESITDLLPGEGSSVTVAQGTGTVTVTAPSYALRRVEDYISDLNERLGRQVTVNVTLLSLDYSDVDNYDMEISELLAPIGRFDLNFSNALPLAGDTDVPATLGFSGVITNNWEISAVINALSTSGRLTGRQNASVTTMNGRPAPLQVVQQQAYIRERSVVAFEGGGQEVTVTPGQITTGLTVNVLPRILSDGELVLSYNLSVSRLLALDSVESGEDGTIQLPSTSINTFMQQTMMQSGATLVLAGVDESTANKDERGVGTSRFHLLGGGKRASMRRNVLIVLITPRVHQAWSARRVADSSR